MLSILFIAVLIGMRHALEADHVAAVACLATRSRSPREIIRLGAIWGLGHTFTLLVAGSIVMLHGSLAPEFAAQALELAVGVMLVLLGGDVIRRMIRDRVHFHIHTHEETVHLHAHSHVGERDHASSPHDHGHPERLSWRALIVGMVHGMAGSAALVLLTLGTIKSFWLGVAYMAVFGLGSIAGMATLSFVIAFPLRMTVKRLTWACNGLTLAVGLTTMALGAVLVYEIGFKKGLLI